MTRVLEKKEEVIYSNTGNKSLLNLLDENCLKILDVGCGTGDNAALIKDKNLLEQ